MRHENSAMQVFSITRTLFTYEQFSNITIPDRLLKMRFKEEKHLKHLYEVNMLYFLLFGLNAYLAKIPEIAGAEF